MTHLMRIFHPAGLPGPDRTGGSFLITALTRYGKRRRQRKSLCRSERRRPEGYQPGRLQSATGQPERCHPAWCRSTGANLNGASLKPRIWKRQTGPGTTAKRAAELCQPGFCQPEGCQPDGRQLLPQQYAGGTNWMAPPCTKPTCRKFTLDKASLQQYVDATAVNLSYSWLFKANLPAPC